jgi:hypothetical protein
MKAIASILAPLALAATILPPLLFLLKWLSLEPMKLILLCARFATASFWLKGAEE